MQSFINNIYALIVDFTSAFNTTDQLLIIAFDPRFPTDAIDVVTNLYYQAHTRIRLPSGCTGDIPIERETTKSHFMFYFLESGAQSTISTSRKKRKRKLLRR
jgi:hypothetical protein